MAPFRSVTPVSLSKARCSEHPSFPELHLCHVQPPRLVKLDIDSRVGSWSCLGYVTAGWQVWLKLLVCILTTTWMITRMPGWSQNPGLFGTFLLMQNTVSFIIQKWHVLTANIKQYHKVLYVHLIFYNLGIIVLSIDGLGSSIQKIMLSLDRVIFISTCI